METLAHTSAMRFARSSAPPHKPALPSWSWRWGRNGDGTLVARFASEIETSVTAKEGSYGILFPV